MTLDSILLIAIIVFTFTAFVREWLPIDVVALSSLALLLAFDLVTPEQAVAGFSNPAVVTVMMMFVLSEALVQSGLVSQMGHRIARHSGESRWKASILLLSLAAVLSAFVNNTAAVAVLMPVAIFLAKHYKFSPSKILLPLSYVSIFGGTCTLLGTSTNLLVSSMAKDRGLEPFSLFEFLWLGLPLLVLGMLYSLFGLMRYLPSRTIISSLTRKYHLSAYLTEVRVSDDSSLIGRTVVEERIRERFDLNVLEILRGARKIASDLRNTRIEAGDTLIIRGGFEEIVRFREQYGLLLLSDMKLEDGDLSDDDNILMEIQLSPQSQFEGMSLQQIDFRKRYGCFVLALNRHGAGMMQSKLAHISLKRWDSFLVFGPRSRVEALAGYDDFIPLEELGIRLQLAKKWWISALVIPGVVTAAMLGMPILKASILGAVFLLVTRRLSIQQAYGSISWTVIFLIAALLPLGIAMEETGLANLIADGLSQVAAPFGPLAILALIVLVTALMTEIISNNAAAVLMVPVAVSLAQAQSLDPKPLLMGVAFAASAAFLTPMGYQTNTMVYGPGGYRFMDYLKAGAPLKIAFWIIASLAIPQIWSF